MYNVYNSMLFNAMLIAAITIRLYRDEKENKDLIWFDLIYQRYGSTEQDSDPYQNVKDPQQWYKL